VSGSHRGVSDIQLEPSATAARVDGRFGSRPFSVRSVNVKWYVKAKGPRYITKSTAVDYDLELTGQQPAVSSCGSTRRGRIDAVYLFDERQLRDESIARGVKRGTVSGFTRRQWKPSQIHPVTCERRLATPSTHAASRCDD
jgi:hypothetical protein